MDVSKKKLRKLIRHAWVHSGYPSCGYDQMTTEQRKLFCKVIGARYEEYNKEFFESRRVRNNEGELVYGVHPDGRRVFPLCDNYRRAGFVELKDDQVPPRPAKNAGGKTHD